LAHSSAHPVQGAPAGRRARRPARGDIPSGRMRKALLRNGMASPSASPRRICMKFVERFRRICKSTRRLFQDSPAVCLVVLAIIGLLLLIGGLFSFVVSRYVGYKSTVVVDLVIVWSFARLVARSLLFPGSVKLFQRNTEATFRTEMSRQYAHFLRQFLSFAKHAAHRGDAINRGVTCDGVYRGSAVIDSLAHSFKMQMTQHEVRLNVLQAEVQILVQEIDEWMKLASVRLVRERPGQLGPAGHVMPMLEWLRAQAHSPRQDSHTQCLESVEFASNADDAIQALSKLTKLLGILDELRHAAKSCLSTVTRFMREPAVGSLNQLRTELQMRYGGQRCWIPTSGRNKIDGMFIPCYGGNRPAQQEEAKEDAPLKGASGSRTVNFSGPTIIWCNPNAGYYETMVYQANWLNFWLSHGVNLFLFNYAGYGSSTGLPTPSRIAQDGDAVVAFLKSKGITQIGVYGRSIGGVTACQLARKHPEDIKLLIADRTMSQLQTAAKYLYGAWAAAGLQLTRMVHDNVDNFWEVRCYKLLIVDPKDTMILDLASLRTAIALRVVEGMRPEERFDIDDETLSALAGVWRFFQALFAVCESDEEGLELALGHEPLSGVSARRDARTPVLLRDEQRPSNAGSSDGSGYSVASTGGSASERVGAKWLQEHASVVRSVMSMFVDQLRSIMDSVGERIEGGGTTLNDVFLDNPSDPAPALRSMLANMQVWGTVGSMSMDFDHLGDASPPMLPHQHAVRVPEGGGAAPAADVDRDIEAFLRKDLGHDFPSNGEATPQRLRQIGRSLLPGTLLDFHRRLARTQVAQARKEFRRRLSALQPALSSLVASMSSASPKEIAEADRLVYTVENSLCEVDAFVCSLGRFFKNVDLALSYSSRRQHEVGGHEGGGLQGTNGLSDPNGLSDSSDDKMMDCLAEPAEEMWPPSAAKMDAAPLAPQPAIDHTTAGYIMHIDCGHNGAMDEVDLRQLALHLRAARFGQTPPEYC